MDEQMGEPSPKLGESEFLTTNDDDVMMDYLQFDTRQGDVGTPNLARLDGGFQQMEDSERITFGDGQIKQEVAPGTLFGPDVIGLDAINSASPAEGSNPSSLSSNVVSPQNGNGHRHGSNNGIPENGNWQQFTLNHDHTDEDQVDIFGMQGDRRTGQGENTGATTINSLFGLDDSEERKDVSLFGLSRDTKVEDHKDGGLFNLDGDYDSTTSNNNGPYRAAQAELNAMKFGRIYNEQSTPTPTPIRSFADNGNEFAELLQTGVDPSQYKYRLYVIDMPQKSRVETQIKCRLVISNTPEEFLLHLPSDTIARPKFQLHDKFVSSPNALDLDVDVISEATPNKPVYICSRCMNRERKRAFRKKNLDENEKRHWDEDRARRLTIFNCKEVVTLSLAKPCDVDNDTIVQGKEVEVPMRLACYSRHHGPKKGFRLLFTLRDGAGEIIARTMTDRILVTDDHKDRKDPSRGPIGRPLNGLTPWNGGLNGSGSGNVSGGGSATGPPSPMSGEAESSEAFSDHSVHSLKRRRDSGWSGSTRQQWPYTSASGTSSTSLVKLAQDLDLPSPQSSDQAGRFQAIDDSLTPISPQVQRIIPAQGSIRGGVEVTLLGSGFHSNLSVMFGDVKSMSTQCWSESTIVTHLPPAAAPGPVVVSFEGYAMSNPQIFTYYDDTDRQLIELALQVVGMKMNGKLEDARNIARRIVGTGNETPAAAMEQDVSGGNGGGSSYQDGFQDSLLSNESHETVTLRCIELICVSAGGKLPNWQLRNSEGQTMMHLAAALGYYKVVVALASQGARVDTQDANGMTPLHFACLHGQGRIVDTLLRCRADPYMETSCGDTCMDLAADNVQELLPQGLDRWEYRKYSRTSSSSTLASSIDRQLNMYAGDSEEDDEVSLPRIASHASSLNYSGSSLSSEDENDEFDSEEPAEDELSLEIVPSFSARDVTRLTVYSPRPESPASDSSCEQAQSLGPARNISNYLTRLSANARNRMHWDGPTTWEEALGYIFSNRSRRRTPPPPQRRDVVSDSDTATVVSDADGARSDGDRSTKANISRMWQYFKSPTAPPPSYDEIFPDEKLKPETSQVEAPQSVPAASAASAASAVSPPPTEATETGREKAQPVPAQSYGIRFVQEWASNTNRINLSNDRMLLFFWLPVLVIAIGYYGLKRAGVLDTEVSVDAMGAYVREQLSYLVVGKKVVDDRNAKALTTMVGVVTKDNYCIEPVAAAASAA